MVAAEAGSKSTSGIRLYLLMLVQISRSSSSAR